MGCLCDKNRKPKDIPEDNSKVYSWDQRRQNVDLKDYTLENLEHTEAWKLPGSIDGQQFIVRNCKNTKIHLLDHINTLTVDDCIDCTFIVGPVKGSVFFRDCKDCNCLVACGQYRMRDCFNANVFLCCPTQPIIESSRKIYFGCFQFNYNQLEEQFKSASLSVFNNNWSNVHDFTPTHGEINWSMLSAAARVCDYIQPPTHNVLNISMEREESVVPLTGGIYPEPAQDFETCLVVFFHSSQEEKIAKSFIRKFSEDRRNCWLVSCRQLVLEPRDAEVVFGSPAYSRQAQSGPLIGLVCSGPRVIYSCQKVLKKVISGRDQTYISTNPRTAAIQADTFVSVAAMVMAS